jgi:dimethylhistidine N-methyltransferase
MNPVDPLLRDVLVGLSSNPKTLPPELFYDQRGSELFEQITELPEYYLTRAETALLEHHGANIAAALIDSSSEPVVIIEPGCGSSTKAMALLRHLPNSAFVGVDVCGDALARGARALRALMPGLQVHARIDNFLRDLPGDLLPPGRRVAFFSGSTLGNFEPPAARAFVGQLARMVGDGGVVLLGLDRWKAPSLLRAAYDDAAGVTAAFNRNALTHLATRFGLRIDSDAFEHHVVVDSNVRRVEMHLRARRPVSFELAGKAIRFTAGESVRTEHCYKFDVERVTALIEGEGLFLARSWSDPEDRFDLYLLRVPSAVRCRSSATAGSRTPTGCSQPGLIGEAE